MSYFRYLRLRCRYAFGMELPDVPVGSRWVLIDDMGKKGPWPVTDAAHAVVTDVKDGWVRYDIGYIRDNRMTIPNFCSMYWRIDGTSKSI